MWWATTGLCEMDAVYLKADENLREATSQAWNLKTLSLPFDYTVCAYTFPCDYWAHRDPELTYTYFCEIGSLLSKDTLIWLILIFIIVDEITKVAALVLGTFYTLMTKETVKSEHDHFNVFGIQLC